MKILPKTRLGKYSVLLIIAVPILLFIGMSSVDFYESVPAGKTILQDIIARPGIALPMLAGFICGIASFFTGITSIFKKKERAILVFLSTILGLLVLLWCLTQIVFAH